MLLTPQGLIMDNLALKDIVENGGVKARDLAKHSTSLATISLPKKLQADARKFLIDDDTLCFKIEKYQGKHWCKQSEKSEIENWIKHFENDIYVRHDRGLRVVESQFIVNIVERDYYEFQPRKKRMTRLHNERS